MSLTLNEVSKVAKLSRLELSAEDLSRMQTQLSNILDYVNQLQAIPTDHVEPMAHPLPLSNVFREDEPGVSLTPDEALKNAPLRYGDYFGVPAVFETDEPMSH
jgi:aspartyl-tRNA(Asn)/glutamyl-tRNA(Gln) amidotransferase subunit C